MKKLGLAVVTLAVLAASSTSQAPEWTEVTTSTRPAVRGGHRMVYDSQRDKVILYGGYSVAAGAYNDTWEYDGSNWTQVWPLNYPSFRSVHAMAYDSARGKVVLFGGSGYGVTFGDTWEYDGVNWTQVATANSPSPRVYHSMAYDSARGKVVLFGGSTVGSIIGDTWEYDGVDWTQVTPAVSPGARRAPAMVYSAARGKVVLYGGVYYSPQNFYDDTWEFDGVNWTEVTTTIQPSARSQHAMAYDALRARVVAFGGWVNPGGSLGDTWWHDGGNWTQVTTTSIPPARERHAMAYDTVRDKVVMFAGYDSGTFLNDTWELDGGTPPAVYPASASTYGAGCGNPALGFLPTSNPIIGTTAGTLIANAPTSFGWASLGLSDTLVNGLPILPFDLAAVGMPGCLLLHSNDSAGFAAVPVTASTLQFDVPIPFAPPLLGADIYLQAFGFAPTVNPTQFVTSNGVHWLVGNQ